MTGEAKHRVLDGKTHWQSTFGAMLLLIAELHVLPVGALGAWGVAMLLIGALVVQKYAIEALLCYVYYGQLVAPLTAGERREKHR